MITVIVSLFDKKSRVYKNPFFVANTEVAVRSLGGAVNAKEPSDLTQFPEDFSLHQIGTFDDETGVITPIGAPVHICNAIQLQKPAFSGAGISGLDEPTAIQQATARAEVAEAACKLLRAELSARPVNLIKEK